MLDVRTGGSTMRLKSLEVFGFKSFADRMRFEFEPGITGVVGPNGCGKSNVTDALRWVMGEQSAKSLRGGEMNDVIFGGSARRKPMGYCEVVVTFENKDRRLPIDHDEVSLGRRLYRTGEGEYYINKELCRLRDIREMIMDTGAGTASYCFIAQGQIDRLLTSDPKERRLVFEEAAGIAKYRQRKAAAMRKLERVDQNLQVLSSVRDEVDKRLRSVARQAQKARRCRRLQDELKEKQVVLALKDYKELLAARASLDTELAALRAREQDAQTRTAAEEATVSRAELQEGELERSASDADARRMRAQAEVEVLEAEIKHAEERAADLESRMRAAAEQIEALEVQLRERTVARERQREEKTHVDENLSGCRASLESVRTASENSVQRERELSERVEHCQARALEAVRARADAQNRLSASESDARNLASRIERLESDQTAIGREYDTARARAEEAAGRCTDASDHLVQAQASSGDCQGQIESLGRQMTGLDEMLGRKRAEIESRRARLAYLKELEDKREGISSGSREVMKAAREENVKFGKVLGLVAELVKAHPDAETAIETALGGRASDLVVDSSTTAGVAIDFLRVGRLGRASFLPLDQMRRTLVLPPELAKEPGVIGRACDLLEFTPELTPAIEYLLGRVLIVRDRQTALRMALLAGPGTRMVTLDGEIVDGNGPITGGMSHSGNPGLLTRRTEIAKLELIINEAEAMLVELSRNQSTVELKRQWLLGIAGDLAALERAADGNLAEARAALQSLRKEEKNLQARQFILAAEYDEARRDRDAATLGLDGLRARVASLEQEETVARDEAERLRGEAAGSRSHRERSEKDLADLRVRMKGLEEKQGAIDAALADSVGEIEERGRTIAVRREEITQMLARAGESRAAAEQSRARVAEQAGMLEQLAAESLAARAKRDELRGHLEAMRKANKNSRTDLLEAQQALNEFRVKEGGIVLKIDSLEERARNEYGVSLAERVAEDEARQAAASAAASGAPSAEAAVVPDAAAPDVPAATPDAGVVAKQHTEGDEGEEGEEDADVPDARAVDQIPTEELRARIEELRRKLESMGTVNMFALEEQRELEERSTFLRTQHDDLTKAQNSLREVIGKINRKSRDLFQETFNDVQARFRDLFRKLFGGGKADVFLEEGVDVLEAGIEVIAQPPGREALKLSLLSGGQKAMTTIALLFAIFGAKPSPFCVLDEVDAPLDDANVDRFNLILREYTNTTQFIVITHNKATMGYASALYGVTMQEPGVSRKVSIRLEDIDDSMQIRPQTIAEVDAEGPFAKQEKAA
jgi:chromosome segregation protein